MTNACFVKFIVNINFITTQIKEWVLSDHEIVTHYAFLNDTAVFIFKERNLSHLCLLYPDQSEKIYLHAYITSLDVIIDIKNVFISGDKLAVYYKQWINLNQNVVSNFQLDIFAMPIPVQEGKKRIREY